MTNSNKTEVSPFIAAGLAQAGVVIPETKNPEDFRESIEKLVKDRYSLTAFIEIYLTPNLQWKSYLDEIADLSVPYGWVKYAVSRHVEDFVRSASHAKSGQLFLPATEFPLDEKATEEVADMFLRGSKKYRFPITATIPFINSLALSIEKRTKLLRRGLIREINTPVTTSYFESSAVTYMRALMNEPTHKTSALVGYDEKVVEVTLPAYINSQFELTPNLINELILTIKSLPKRSKNFRTDAYLFDDTGEPLFIDYCGADETTEGFNKALAEKLSEPFGKIEKIIYKATYNIANTNAIENAILNDNEAATIWLNNPYISREIAETIYASDNSIHGNTICTAHPDISLAYALEANQKSLDKFQKLADEMD